MVSRALPVCLLDNNYFYPKTILKENKFLTNEKVCILDIKLAFIPRSRVKWKVYPTDGYRDDLIFAYFITALTDNPEAKVVQYLLNPALNEKFRFQCGDVILLREIATLPRCEGLTRSFLSIENVRLLKKHAGTVKMVQEMDDLDDDKVREIYKDMDDLYFPSQDFYPLNYWCEQAVHFPRNSAHFTPPPTQHLKSINDESAHLPHEVFAQLATFKELEEAYPSENVFLKISDLDSRRNLAIRVNKGELLAVILSVRKPINISDTSANPVRIVMTIADFTGVCDVVLWRKTAFQCNAEVQIGSLVIISGWTIKNVRVDNYALTHPDAPRVPLELSLDEDKPTAIRVFPRKFLKRFSLPDPFHNLISLDQVERQKTDEHVSSYVTIIGLIVGISRYHTQNNTSTFHVGRTYVRRWIDLWEPSSGATVSVALYVNRNLERHLSIRLNRVLCLTNVMVKHLSCFDHLQFTHVTNSVNTEIFVIPGLDADRLPETIAIKAEEILTSSVQPEITWTGGCHVLENYLMSKNGLSECSLNRKWGAEELKKCAQTLLFNRQIDFIFRSRIVMIEYCHLPRHFRWKDEALPLLEVSAEIVWMDDNWEMERKRVRTHYGREQLNFNVLNLAFRDASCAGASYAMSSICFPPTTLAERKKTLMECAPNGTEMEAEVCNHGIYRLTLKHEKDDVAISCLFNAEDEPEGVKLVDVIRLKFQPNRKCLDSAVVSQRESKKRLIRPDVEGLTKVEVEAWIRVQCISRENLEFTLMYL